MEVAASQAFQHDHYPYFCPRQDNSGTCMFTVIDATPLSLNTQSNKSVTICAKKLSHSPISKNPNPKTSNPIRKLIIQSSRDVFFWDLSSYSHVKKKNSNLFCSGQPEHCRLKFIHSLIVIALGFWKKTSCRYYVENYVETCDFQCGKLDIHVLLLWKI